MKKRIYELVCLLILVITAFSICSCGGKKDAAQENSSENSGNKVILVLVDGMRPDGFEQCGNAYTEELKKNSLYTMNARTVFPSMTLPAHLSLFYDVSPEVHGTTTNTFSPQDTVLEGLFERLDTAQKKSCIYYSWEPLRDISKPKAVTSSEYIKLGDFEDPDSMVTDRALKGIKEFKPDFAFIYLGKTDDVGHSFGWMSEEYLSSINAAMDDVKRIIDETKGDYTVILTADHGGHNKTHGFDSDEDMTIPMFLCGKDIDKGELKSDVSILDVAPTVLDIIGVTKPEKWEGKSLVPAKTN